LQHGRIKLNAQFSQKNLGIILFKGYEEYVQNQLKHIKVKCFFRDKLLMMYCEKKINLEPEKISIFHTNRPRDPKTRMHLWLIFLSFVSALTIAIIFTEYKNKGFPLAAQRTLLKEKPNR
jgi:hypothetical protein